MMGTLDIDSSHFELYQLQAKESSSLSPGRRLYEAQTRRLGGPDYIIDRDSYWPYIVPEVRAGYEKWAKELGQKYGMLIEPIEQSYDMIIMSYGIACLAVVLSGLFLLAVLISGVGGCSQGIGLHKSSLSSTPNTGCDTLQRKRGFARNACKDYGHCDEFISLGNQMNVAGCEDE